MLGGTCVLNTQQQSPLPDPSVLSRVVQAGVQGRGDAQKEAESSSSAAGKPVGAVGGRAAPRGRALFPRAALPLPALGFRHLAPLFTL